MSIRLTYFAEQVRPMAEPNGSADTETLIELLFFAYRDFISDADAILAELDFGRAHHRVMHFGLTVAELLAFLGITKQSLSRVLKQLIDGGFVRQDAGHGDRRRRQLHLTGKGQALIARLREPQSRRIDTALTESGQSHDAMARFLKAMAGDQARAQIRALK